MDRDDPLLVLDSMWSPTYRTRSRREMVTTGPDSSRSTRWSGRPIGPRRHRRMGRSEGWEEPTLEDPARGKPGTGRVERWHRRIVVGVVGAVYFAALGFDIGADGGRDAALFYGITGFAITFPILLLLGKFVAAVVGKIRILK